MGIVKMPAIRQFQTFLSYRSYATKAFKHRTRYEWQKLKKKAHAPVSNPKDVSVGKIGGSKEIAAKVQYPHYQRVAPTGKFDEQTKQYRNIKEMVPEFIVPDLKDFKLKAYVPWGIDDVKQSEFTPRDLFFATYAKDIKTDFEENRLDLDDTKKDNS